jgi:hypothetical protein
MLIAKFYLPLSNGKFISYEEIIGTCEIYDVISRSNCYILIPKIEQNVISTDVFIIANAHGIRIVHRNGWPYALTSKVNTISTCIKNNKITNINSIRIPSDILGIICEKLVKQFSFESIKI